MKRTSLALMVCFTALVLLSCACRKKQVDAVPTSSASGTKAADFVLYDMDAKKVTLSSLKGKVVLLDFWATWCYPCRMEIPHFKGLYDKYRADGLEVVGIALDKGGAETVKPFAEQERINYTIVIGNDDVVASYGGIRAIPTTFVINKDGSVYSKYVGVPKDINVFEQDIRKLLGK